MRPVSSRRHCRLRSLTQSRIGIAGLPIIRAPGATSAITTAPEPISAPAPTCNQRRRLPFATLPCGAIFTPEPMRTWPASEVSKVMVV